MEAASGHSLIHIQTGSDSVPWNPPAKQVVKLLSLCSPCQWGLVINYGIGGSGGGGFKMRKLWI